MPDKTMTLPSALVARTLEALEALLPSPEDDNHDGYDARDVREWRSSAASLREAMKQPCRSPYCECEQGHCTHPGFYDARHAPQSLGMPGTGELRVALSDSVVKLILDALAHGGLLKMRQALTALRAALAQPGVAFFDERRAHPAQVEQPTAQLPSVADQEPRAYIEHHKGGDNLIWTAEKTSPRVTELYTREQLKKPPLTDAQAKALLAKLTGRDPAYANDYNWDYELQIIRAIENRV